LREDTEEIILKRQRNQVESAKHFVETAVTLRDRQLKVDSPRQEIAAKEHAIRQTLALEKTKSSLPLNLSQKKLGLERRKYDHDKSADRFKKLKKDREMMTVKAPTDGIVYYGKCVRGQWSSASMISSKLQKGGMAMPDEVLMTIVKPRSLFIRATVEEKDLRD